MIEYYTRMVDNMDNKKTENIEVKYNDEIDLSPKNNKNNNESKKFSLFEVIVLIILSVTISMSLGMIIVEHGHRSKQQKIVEPKDEYLENFVENYNYILNNYYGEVDREKIINSAIAGMMDSLDDPYSVYIDDDTSNNFNINLQGNYQGLGVSIVKDPTTNYIMIYSVFKDSPADKAGLKSTDIIKSVDGKLTTDVETSEFSESILKSEQKEYTLVIIRNNEEFEVKITKENVIIDSVNSRLIEQDDKKIGYIYISIFANNTATQFHKELLDLENQGIDALIIDVRANTGGHLTAVEAILELFLTKEQITYKLDDGEKVTDYYGKSNNNKKYEIVLLGDEYSASASEVLISSLRDNLGSKLIGAKTYGKGTVQELITLSNGVQYKITTQKWLSPKGNWVNDTEGIIPDIEVKMDEQYYRTYNNEDDNQLQTAINYIVNENN